MYKQVAAFLLDHPPLDEIGGPITHIIENYRYKLLTKEDAIQMILDDYKNVLSRYIEQSSLLSEFERCR